MSAPPAGSLSLATPRDDPFAGPLGCAAATARAQSLTAHTETAEMDGGDTHGASDSGIEIAMVGQWKRGGWRCGPFDSRSLRVLTSWLDEPDAFVQL